MTRVDYFRAEVRYTGRFEDYSLEDWRAKARAVQDRGIDCFFDSIEEDDLLAQVVDGKTFVENYMPCDKIALVEWAYIAEEVEA